MTLSCATAERRPQVPASALAPAQSLWQSALWPQPATGRDTCDREENDMTTPGLIGVPSTRREFLTHLGCAASASLLAGSAVRAQQQAKIWRVGIILAGT